MRVHHLAFRTEDVDTLVAFYVRVFGFAIARTQRDDAGTRSVWLALEPPPAVLMIERADEGEAGVPAGSLELVAFAVDRDEAAAIAARVEVEARTEHTLYFRDPDGRRLGVSTHPLTT